MCVVFYTGTIPWQQQKNNCGKFQMFSPAFVFFADKLSCCIVTEQGRRTKILRPFVI